jgi:hypothetical protein
MLDQRSEARPGCGVSTDGREVQVCKEQMFATDRGKWRDGVWMDVCKSRIPEAAAAAGPTS